MPIRLRKVLCPYEEDDQASLFAWMNTVRYNHPVMGKIIIGSYAYAVPNGTFLAGIPRVRAAQMARLKKAGLKPGVQDICIMIPVEPYHGLYIEMKRLTGGTTSDDQLEWQQRARLMGYKSEICPGYEAGRLEISIYFNL